MIIVLNKYSYSTLISTHPPPADNLQYIIEFPLNEPTTPLHRPAIHLSYRIVGSEIYPRANLSKQNVDVTSTSRQRLQKYSILDVNASER